MVEDYIKTAGDKAFRTDDGELVDVVTQKVYDFEDFEEQNSYKGEEHVREDFLKNALYEMTRYLFEIRNELDTDNEGWGDTLIPENIENIYLSQRPFEPSVVIVEFHETPEWFHMQNAEFREFYWHPHPAHSGEMTGAYFQPR